VTAFKCPACGAPLSVADDHAGKSVRCPKCQNATTVPRLAQVAPTAEPVPPRAGPFTTRDTLRVALWVLCALGAVMLTLEYFSGSRLDTSAVQQGARAARTAALAVLGYVFCRAVDAILRVSPRQD
jgi:predicted Zn finger-like uncharacterized protein